MNKTNNQRAMYSDRTVMEHTLYPMRPTGGGYFLRTNFSPRTKIGIFERRLEFEDCICFNRNPIKSKLLGRIAADAQQQQRAHQIDRRLSHICARKTGFWFF